MFIIFIYNLPCFKIKLHNIYAALVEYPTICQANVFEGILKKTMTNNLYLTKTNFVWEKQNLFGQKKFGETM